jgi:putative endonuclease
MADRRKALGAEGEAAACELLRKSGYRVLERNWRNRWGELDAVAWQDGQIVFVEVRARSSEDFGTPAESVTAGKRRRLVRMAQLYLQEKAAAEQSCRFDVVEMAPLAGGGWQGHVIRDAFAADGR